MWYLLSAVEVCTEKAFCLPVWRDLFTVFTGVQSKFFFFFSFPSCLLSFSSYVVNMGLIDKLYGCFLSVQGPVDDHPKMSAFLQQASALLHGMCKLCFVVTGR